MAGRAALWLALLAPVACSPATTAPGDARRADGGANDLAARDAGGDGLPSDRGNATDSVADRPANDGDDPDAPRTAIVVVTFNTGTSETMGHDNPPDDGYTSAHAARSDQYYGDGLAWSKAVAATQAFFAALQPDIVVFQEIFHSADCATIPVEAQQDFVCETWTAGDPTVAQRVLGPGWQVMCHPGKPDKCAAVRRAFGSFRGCASDYCLEGLDGATIDGCGKGARVGRGLIDRAGGGTITLVNVHGSSGLTADDMQCRKAQFEQVFVDLGDGAPAANGSPALIMGDLNTDPGRVALLDESAARFNDFAGPGKPFHFITAVGPTAPPSYAGLFNIDHVVSDVATGSCWTAGVSAGHPEVIDAVYFDHKPVVCTVELPPP